MLSVLKKDFKVQFFNFKGLNSLSLLIAVVFPILIPGTSFIYMFLLMVSFTAIATVQLELKQKTHTSFLSVACTRKEYVLSKFISLIINNLFFLVVGIVLNKILNLISPKYFLEYPLYRVFLLTLSVTLLGEMYYFVAYSFGQKIATLTYFILIAISIGFMTIFQNGSLTMSGILNFILRNKVTLNFRSSTGILIFVLSFIVLSIISMFLTLFFYNRKDI